MLSQFPKNLFSSHLFSSTPATARVHDLIKDDALKAPQITCTYKFYCKWQLFICISSLTTAHQNLQASVSLKKCRRICPAAPSACYFLKHYAHIKYHGGGVIKYADSSFLALINRQLARAHYRKGVGHISAVVK